MQNVTVLAATPVANSNSAGDLWWAWLLIALLGSCLCCLVVGLGLRERRRRERELELQQRRLQEQAASGKSAGGFYPGPEDDVEAIADSPRKSPEGPETGGGASSSSPSQTTSSSSPKNVSAPPGTITQMKSSNSSPTIPPEFAAKRKQEDLREAKEARERRAARRSVMKLLSAMNELEDAFQTVEKELETDAAIGKTEEDDNLDDVENRIRLDDENVRQENITPSRFRSNTSSPRKRAPLRPISANKTEIKRIAEKEARELALEMRSQKIHSAIGKLESAIGNLEQRIVHEKVKSMGKAHRNDHHNVHHHHHSHHYHERKSAPDHRNHHHLDRSARMSNGSMMSGGNGSSFHHDSSMEDSLNTSADSVVDTHRLSTLIVGRASRGMPMI